MAILYPDEIYNIRVDNAPFTGNIISVGKDVQYSYDYYTISDAIGAAYTGDMILIYPGEYVEDFTISKSLILRGMGTAPDQVRIQQANTAYNADFIVLSYSSSTQEIIFENLSVYSQTSYSWATNINLNGSGGVGRLNKVYSLPQYNSRYALGLGSYTGAFYATNCRFDKGYAHIVNADHVTVFSLLRMEYDEPFSCYSCAVSPIPHDYVTTFTFGYGQYYGDYIVEFVQAPEAEEVITTGNLSINSYNIFQASASGVNVYTLSGTGVGVLELPEGHGPTIIEQGYIWDSSIYVEDFGNTSAEYDWDEIAGAGDVYDFTEGYMRNNNSSTTFSEAVTYEEYTVNDFDIKLKMMQGSGAGSLCDTFMYFFYSRQWPSPEGPYLYIRLTSYFGGDPWNFFLFSLTNASGTELYHNELQKYDYKSETGTWFWGRVRRDGDDFYFKHWSDEESEPASWDDTVTLSGLGEFSGPLYAYTRTGNTTIGCGFDDIIIEGSVYTETYGYHDITSVYANDDHLYVSTSLSGIYYTTASGAVNNTLTPFKQYPDINDNEVIYVHGAGDYLCATTAAGVSRYNLTTGSGIYTQATNLYKCHQTTSGTLYYIRNSTFLSPNEVDLGDRIENWQYYQLITFTATSVSDENVTIEFSSDFPYQNSSEGGADLRFIDEAGNNLTYYIEEWYPNAVILVKVPIIGTSNLHMIYGNTSAPAQSSTDAYYFYDDFDVLNTDVWQVNTRGDGVVEIVDGYLRLYDADNDGTEVITKQGIPHSMFIEARVRRNGGSNASQYDGEFGYCAGLSSINPRIGRVKIDPSQGPDETLHFLDAIDDSITGTVPISTEWKVWEGLWAPGYQRSYYDGETLELYVSNVLFRSSSEGHFFFHINNSSSNPDMNVDWVRMQTWPFNITYTSTQGSLWELIKPNLYAVYNPTSDWVEADYIYSNFFGDPVYLNDIFVTEETSSYGNSNTIFLATDKGAHVIEERQGDEENANTKRYYIS